MTTPNLLEHGSHRTAQRLETTYLYVLNVGRCRVTIEHNLAGYVTREMSCRVRAYKPDHDLPVAPRATWAVRAALDGASGSDPKEGPRGPRETRRLGGCR